MAHLKSTVKFCRLALAFAASLWLCPASATAEELDIPRLSPWQNSTNPVQRATLTQKARTLFEADKYQELDALAARLRRDKEKDRDGNWKLPVFYKALAFESTGMLRSENDWNGRSKEINKWIAARPSSITPRVVLAHHLVNFAWRGRGNGTADKVTEQGWIQFSERLALADTALKDAQKLTEKCPEWYSVRLMMAMGQGWEKGPYNRLFEEAVAFAPDYQDYYQRKAYALQPRWFGQPGEWQTFAEASAKRFPGRVGDALYAHICAPMLGMMTEKDFIDTGLDWGRLRRGLLALVEDYPDSQKWPNYLARYATWASDMATAREGFLKILGNTDLGIWYRESFYKECREWALNNPLPKVAK